MSWGDTFHVCDATYNLQHLFCSFSSSITPHNRCSLCSSVVQVQCKGNMQFTYLFTYLIIYLFIHLSVFLQLPTSGHNSHSHSNAEFLGNQKGWIEKSIPEFFLLGQNALSYMMLKIDEFKMNLSEILKWKDTAACKYCTRDFIVLYLCQGRASFCSLHLSSKHTLCI